MSSRPTFHAARRLAWEAASVLPLEDVPLADAVGRMLAHDVIALADVPHYASSAMDGWAVAGPPPWRIGSGAVVEPGGGVPIVTGGLVPTGTEAILRHEHGTAAGEILTPTVVPEPGRHIRPAGEEARAGDVVISSGTALTPVRVAVAAGCGHDAVRVVRRPRVGFVFTGTEVVTSGVPDAGHVRDSFDPMLPAVLHALGADVARRDRIGDDHAALLAESGRADVDILITTGGTGDSPVDHVRAVLDELGAALIIDGLAVRPGAPTVLARLPSGLLLLALPGNPLAAMTALLTLCSPMIGRMRGAAFDALNTVPAGEPIAGTPERTTLLPYRVVAGAAVRCAHTGSGMLRGLAQAEGLLVVPEGGVGPGEDAERIPLPW